MAQDLEKSEAGRSAVFEHDGTKMVNTSRLSLNLAGAMGEMYQRLLKVEAG